MSEWNKANLKPFYVNPRVFIGATDCIPVLRKCASAFVMSGYKPKEDSDNPCEALLFECMDLLARWDSGEKGDRHGQ